MVSLSFIGLSLAVTALAAQTAEAAATSKGVHHGTTVARSHKHQEHHASKKLAQAHKRSTTKHAKKHSKKTTKKHTKKSTTKTPPRAGGSASAADIKTILDAHNAYRAKHSAPPLKWSSTLANYAQNWSDNCQFKHSGGKYGENLAMGYADWKSAIAGWYDEVSQYNYNNPGFSGATGHFTQVKDL